MSARGPRLFLLAALGLAVLGAAPAGAADVGVAIPAKYFMPPVVSVLPGDTVTWRNGDSTNHTVVARDGAFASGAIGSGQTFSTTLTDEGAHPYFCTIHTYMTGEVDVVPILLAGPAVMPTAGQPFTLSGRAVAGTGTVSVERAPAPDGPFTTVTTATPAGDGTFSATLPAESSAVWRVASGDKTSPVVSVPVAPRLSVSLSARLTRDNVVLTARTNPARPGGTVRLELYSREHFRWLAASHAKLDKQGAITFTVRRGLRRLARVSFGPSPLPPTGLGPGIPGGHGPGHGMGGPPPPGPGASAPHSRAIALWRVR